jgi:hypothetical protein
LVPAFLAGRIPQITGCEIQILYPPNRPFYDPNQTKVRKRLAAGALHRLPGMARITQRAQTCRSELD